MGRKNRPKGKLGYRVKVSQRSLFSFTVVGSKNTAWTLCKKLFGAMGSYKNVSSEIWGTE